MPGAADEDRYLDPHGPVGPLLQAFSFRGGLTGHRHGGGKDGAGTRSVLLNTSQRR
jgi:hypothetical protein